MGADAPIPPNTMNAATPQTDAPSGVSGCSFLITVILKKTALPSEDQNEAAERPRQGGEHHHEFSVAYLTHMKQGRTDSFLSYPIRVN
jgi:hypothetical protein